MRNPLNLAQMDDTPRGRHSTRELCDSRVLSPITACH